MALKNPDITEHNNTDLAAMDADFVRGANRRVADLTALYALASKVDQLKVFVTKVYVDSLGHDMLLVDIANVGNIAGWAKLDYAKKTGGNTFSGTQNFNDPINMGVYNNEVGGGTSYNTWAVSKNPYWGNLAVTSDGNSNGNWYTMLTFNQRHPTPLRLMYSPGSTAEDGLYLYGGTDYGTSLATGFKVITAKEFAFAETLAHKNVANGYAGLDSGGLIPASLLPSFVDDVLEFANLAAFPVTGATGKIYVTLDTNKTYRWSGSVYVEISASPGSTDAVTEGVTNLYFTVARVLASALTGYAATNGTIAASDTVLQAFNKIGYFIANLAEKLANKDASGGYAGLTLFKINFKNAANTFTSFFTNTNTAARTYTFQDRNGTIADDTDITNAKARANHTGTQTATTIVEDTTHRFATDAEKTTWNAKQNALSIVSDAEMITGTDNAKFATALRINTFWAYLKGTAAQWVLGYMAGGTNRMVQVDTAGTVTASNTIIDQFTTDSDVITAITGATYNSGNNYKAAITPASSKVFNQGQLYTSGSYLYMAVSDNTCARIPLG